MATLKIFDRLIVVLLHIAKKGSLRVIFHPFIATVRECLFFFSFFLSQAHETDARMLQYSKKFRFW